MGLGMIFVVASGFFGLISFFVIALAVPEFVLPFVLSLGCFESSDLFADAAYLMVARGVVRISAAVMFYRVATLHIELWWGTGEQTNADL